MELKQTVLGRRSIRKFKDKPVPADEILDIIRLAVHAPSPGNSQMWHFYVITSRQVNEQMAAVISAGIKSIALAAGKSEDWLEASRRSATFFQNAPVLIAVTADGYRNKVDETLIMSGHTQVEINELRCRPDLQGIGAVIQTLLLAAYEKAWARAG